MAVEERHGTFVIGADEDQVTGPMKISQIQSVGGGVEVLDFQEGYAAPLVVIDVGDGITGFESPVSVRNPRFDFKSGTTKVFVYTCG